MIQSKSSRKKDVHWQSWERPNTSFCLFPTQDHTVHAFSLASNKRYICGMSWPRESSLIFRIWVFGGAGRLGLIIWEAYPATQPAMATQTRDPTMKPGVCNLDDCTEQSDKLGQHGPLLQVYKAKSSFTGIKKYILRAIFPKTILKVFRFPWKQEGISNQTCCFNSFLTKWVTNFPKHLCEKVYLCPVIWDATFIIYRSSLCLFLDFLFFGLSICSCSSTHSVFNRKAL